jgi:hypothetical protein
MALSTVSLTYSGSASSPFDLDVSVSRSRFFRARFAPGETKVVSSLTLDELQQSSILQTLLAAGTFVLSSVEGDTGSGLAVGPVDLTPATAAASANFGAAAAIVGVPFTVRMPLTASGASPGRVDTSIFPATATLPFAVRLLRMESFVTTGVNGATSPAELRTAVSGGGGSPLASTLTTATESATRQVSQQASVSIAAGTQLHLYRERQLAGEVVLHLVRE